MSRYYELGHAEGLCYDYIPTKLLKFEFQATYLTYQLRPEIWIYA